MSTTVLAIILWSGIYCQPTHNKNVYQAVLKIDKADSLSSTYKLQVLYAIKYKVEKGKEVNDSGYVALLLKIAKYEYLVNSNYPVAIALSQKALELNALAGNKKSVYFTINGNFNLAFYYKNISYFQKALDLYDTVISLCNKYKGVNDLDVKARYWKVDIYGKLGNYQKVIDESKIGIIHALSRSDSLDYVYFLNRKSESLEYEKYHQQALADAEAAVLLAKSIKDTYELATAYKLKAMIYESNKQFSLAESFFKQAVATRVQTKKYGQIGADFTDFGNFYLNSLQNFTAAKQQYQQNIIYANKEKDTVKKNYYTALAYGNLAECYTREGNYQKSIQLYQTSFRCVHVDIPDYVSANPSLSQLNAIKEKDFLFSLLFGKVHLLKELYKTTGDKKFIQTCILTALLTDSLITQTRHEQLGEQSKLYWRNKTRDFFGNTIEVCYLSGDTSMAFHFMEKSRAVLLYDKLNELGAGARLPIAEAGNQYNLQMKVLEHQQLLSKLSPSSNEYIQADYKLSQTKSELEDYIKSLEKKYPAYYQYKYVDSVSTLSELQNYLAKNNQSFVHYFANDTAIYALGISNNKTTFVKASAKEFDNHQLTTFLRLCSNKNTLNNNYSQFAALSKTIYTKLFKPLHLNKGNVTICSDNFFIPFEALCTDTEGRKFLLYDYNFNYAYSARTLMKPFARKAANEDFIGFAPVSFAQSLDVVELTQSAIALTNAAKPYNSNTLFTHKEATRSNFFRNASHYSVITVFSHAKADTTEEEPQLYMADSVIHLSELQMLKNPSAQLVLLSACQTNIGKNATGEGIYSLARGFASVGIPSISATLWQADEQTIYQISARFNEYLAAGMNKSEALQKAKIWFVQHCDRQHTLPYYWANMVLIGSPEPVALTASGHILVWVSAAAVSVLLLTLGSIWYARKKRKSNQVNHTPALLHMFNDK